MCQPSPSHPLGLAGCSNTDSQLRWVLIVAALLWPSQYLHFGFCQNRPALCPNKGIVPSSSETLCFGLRFYCTSSQDSSLCSFLVIVSVVGSPPSSTHDLTNESADLRKTAFQLLPALAIWDFSVSSGDPFWWAEENAKCICCCFEALMVFAHEKGTNPLICSWALKGSLCRH